MRLSVTIAAILVVVPVVASFATEKTHNIMVYGDSITWGWLPVEPIVPTTRHAPEDRWPNIMAAELGDGYHVITEGLSGRTTNIDDPTTPGLLDGAEYLDSAMFSHQPIDLVIIMLGTNDTKTYLDRTPLEIGLGMGELINIVKKGSGTGWYTYEDSEPEVLIISPPPLADTIDPLAAEIFIGAQEKIRALSAIYSSIAEAGNAEFFDAATVVELDDVGVDGIHLVAEGNRDLGVAVAQRVKKMIQ